MKFEYSAIKYIKVGRLTIVVIKMASIKNEDGSLKSAEEIRQERFFEVLDRNPKFVDQLAKIEGIESKLGGCPY